MSGFFNRLAQRTLGTAPTVRPAIAPRFAQPSMVNNELPLADTTEEINQQTREKVNRNDNQKLNEPVINHEPVSNQIQEKPMDSPTLHEQSRQAEVQQPEHLVDIQPEGKSKQTQKRVQAENIDKTKKIIENRNVARINPVEVTSKKNKIQTILAETKTETIVDEALVTMPHEHNQKVEKPNAHFEDSDYYLDVDEALVPMPHEYNQKVENSNAHFGDSDYHLDFHQTSGNDRSNRDNTSKQQSLEDNQTINVTIGRVEVRAIHPSPAPIKQSKAKNKSTLSLDDYLQQRQRGER
ncbi:MAG: hypothetical protein V3U75_02915 [Methylococcaceae bacterium]